MGYTLQASALDYDPILDYDSIRSKPYIFSGKRMPSIKGREKRFDPDNPKFKNYYPRGLYRSKNGNIINSDVKGAFNIGRKAFPRLFGKTFVPITRMLINPVKIKV